MNKNPVVKPSRSKPIENIPVEFICKCNWEISQHPTAHCQTFHGDRIREVPVHRLVFSKTERS